MARIYRSLSQEDLVKTVLQKIEGQTSYRFKKLSFLANANLFQLINVCQVIAFLQIEQ